MHLPKSHLPLQQMLTLSRTSVVGPAHKLQPLQTQNYTSFFTFGCLVLVIWGCSLNNSFKTLCHQVNGPSSKSWPSLTARKLLRQTSRPKTPPKHWTHHIRSFCSFQQINSRRFSSTMCLFFFSTQGAQTPTTL